MLANAIEHESVVKLRDSFSRAQHALDSSSEMVSIHDAHTAYLYVNDAFVVGTGFSRDETIGRLPPLRASKPRTEFSGDNWELVKSGTPWSGTYSANRKDGSVYYCLSTLTPVFDHSGEISSYLSIKRDVTDQFIAESLITRSRAKQELVSTVEHELRSPLAAVINFVDLLQISEERRPEIIQALKVSATELASTINDLRSVNSSSDAQLRVSKANASISSLLDNVLARSAVLLEKKRLNLEVVVDKDPSVDELEVDGLRITQLISNLLTNAIRYSPDGNRIKVSLDASGAFTRLVVYNEGVGVSGDEIAMLSHPFFRGTSSGNSDALGSGIGLALSTAIVEAHDGYINFRSDKDEFFEVEVLLPNANLV